MERRFPLWTQGQPSSQRPTPKTTIPSSSHQRQAAEHATTFKLWRWGLWKRSSNFKDVNLVNETLWNLGNDIFRGISVKSGSLRFSWVEHFITFNVLPVCVKGQHLKNWSFYWLFKVSDHSLHLQKVKVRNIFCLSGAENGWDPLFAQHKTFELMNKTSI